jgi:hypothetical protein
MEDSILFNPGKGSPFLSQLGGRRVKFPSNASGILVRSYRPFSPIEEIHPFARAPQIFQGSKEGIKIKIGGTHG